MKNFLDYDQQIEKLKLSNGLIINDEEVAKDFLRLEGYYNVINGYANIFKKDKKFIKGTTFDNIQSLYEFDKSLRGIVYKYTSSIECHIKALIAHEFSRVHGVDENQYLKSTSFSANKNSIDQVNRLIEECKRTITDALNKKSNKYREYIAHNYNKHGHVPMWVLVLALSFGTVSIFYKNMRDDEKDAVARNYHISANKLANILEVVVAFRNIVAHGERIFCARLPRTRLSQKLRIAEKLNIAKNEHGDNKFGRNDFLALLICCKYMLPPIEFDGFLNELNISLDYLSQKLPVNIIAKIKLEMGLSGGGWTNLIKLKIDD